jgi:hypothetical protein
MLQKCTWNHRQVYESLRLYVTARELFKLFLFDVVLEGCPLSLVSTNEEPLGRKVATPVLKSENTAAGIRHADHVASSIRESWH